jgi:tellurite resistance protein TerC
MIREKDKEIHPEKNPLIIFFRRLMPVTREYIGGKFFARINGRVLATPLFVGLLVIESSDVMFAIDSIPAVLAISTDPFIVYTSNIMAILGLRALYFAVASVMKYFRYLSYGLAIILGYIGIKMIAVEFIHIPPFVSLGIIFSVILVSIILSLVIKETDNKLSEV